MHMMCKKRGNRMAAVAAVLLAVSTGICGCGSSDEESTEKTQETVQMAGETVEDTGEGSSAGAEEPVEEFTGQTDTEKRELIYPEGEDLYKVNIFLSNFAEQGFGNYDSDHCSDFQLISFAFQNAKINNAEAVQYIDSEMCISLKDVNSKLERYLGKQINPEENTKYTQEYPEYGYTDVIEFRDGLFRLPAADGESHCIIAAVTAMAQLPDGTYEAEFDIYSIPEMNTGGNVVDSKDYYYLTAEEAANSPGLEYEKSGTAVLEPYHKGNIDSYHLLEYRVDETGSL